MSIMMAVDLLGCTGSTEERAALLHKTIQLAAELKSSLGNMFGFAAVMRALELPQVASPRSLGAVSREGSAHACSLRHALCFRFPAWSRRG